MQTRPAVWATHCGWPNGLLKILILLGHLLPCKAKTLGASIVLTVAP